LPYPLTTAADAVPSEPRIDKVQLYQLGDDVRVIGRLNWVGPVVARYETPTGTGETEPTLANRLHRVELPDDASRVTLRALTTDLAWIEPESATLTEPPTSSAVGQFEPIPVVVTNPTDEPLIGYAQRLGVPFAKGVAADASGLRLAADLPRLGRLAAAGGATRFRHRRHGQRIDEVQEPRARRRPRRRNGRSIRVAT
jgi:hypothetical protein